MIWKLVLVAWVVAFIPRAWADDKDHDHDRARRAVEEGRVLPLTEILTRNQSAYSGQLLEAELEDEDGQLVYELKFLTPDGRRLKVECDATSGAVLKKHYKDR